MENIIKLLHQIRSETNSEPNVYTLEKIRIIAKQAIDEIKKTVESNNFWKDIILTQEGKLDVEQIEKELVDYRFMMEQVPKVYMYATGDKLSKCNYYAASVISAIDDHIQDLIEEALEEKHE